MRNRNLPLAKQAPFVSAEELVLAAAGKLSLPAHELDEKAFWAVRAPVPVSRKLARAAARAITQDREERDSELLGR